jgi:CubicO group peptidase (beta-lactamase class C family)
MELIMTSKEVLWLIAISSIVMLLMPGCSGTHTEFSNTLSPAQQTSTNVTLSIPATPLYWPTEGWRTSTPEEQGMDSEMLVSMMDAIQSQEPPYNIDSITIIRNGYMVLDTTFYPFQPDEKHIIHSCTKSIVSALVGIAIEQGYIKSVKQPVLELFPERTAANLTAEKEAMTLEDVLTMATGLDCQDSYLFNWRGLSKLRQGEDWVQYILDMPMAEVPGKKFEYCNSASFLLSAIIQETAGQNTLEFAKENLFDPLGIYDVTWPTNPQGINIGWGELHMLPHDMAKIGYLYLNEGIWDGKQVISSDWVKTSTRKHISAHTLEDGYGYQWWVDDSGIFLALGYAGQYIVVIPEKEMVAVFTGDLQDRNFFIPRILVDDFIIPAAISHTPLPPNPDGVAELQSLIKEVSSQP